MAFWDLDRGDEASEIEQVLEAIPISPDIKFTYLNMQKNSKKLWPVSPYLLLVDDGPMGDPYGAVPLGTKLTYFPLGFTQKVGAGAKVHYQLDWDGNLYIPKPEDRGRGHIFLPVVKNPVFYPMANMSVPSEQGEQVARAYGVYGSKGLRPLVLITETEAGIECKGMFKSKDNTLDMLAFAGDTRPTSRELSDFLRHLRKMPDKMYINKERRDSVILAVKNKAIADAAEEVAAAIANQEAPAVVTDPKPEINWENPKDIVAYLDGFVIGQEDAKRMAAISFSNYMVKKLLNNDKLPVEHMLMIGPTGTGKTYIMELLAKLGGLRFVEAKATGKSSTGYVGENFASFFNELADPNDPAPYAVVFVDEIDKLARDSMDHQNFYGNQKQNELVGWLQSGIVRVERATQAGRIQIPVNTKNLLFVGAGAFESVNKGYSLDEIIKKRTGSVVETVVGFNAKRKITRAVRDSLGKVSDDDLIQYGMKPELAGRMQKRAILKPLSLDDKVRIITDAKESRLQSYIELAKVKGFDVEIDTPALRYIAQKGSDTTGARGLNAPISMIFDKILYEPEKYAEKEKWIALDEKKVKELIG